MSIAVLFKKHLVFHSFLHNIPIAYFMPDTVLGKGSEQKT